MSTDVIASALLAKAILHQQSAIADGLGATSALVLGCTKAEIDFATWGPVVNAMSLSSPDTAERWAIEQINNALQERIG